MPFNDYQFDKRVLQGYNACNLEYIPHLLVEKNIYLSNFASWCSLRHPVADLLKNFALHVLD